MDSSSDTLLVRGTPPPPAAAYTINFESAPANRVLWRVSLGRGVVYQGTGTPSTAPISLFGKRYLNGRLNPNGSDVRVLSLAGSQRLTVTQKGSNTPMPTGGSLQLKFYNQPSKLVQVQSLTLTNLSGQGLSQGQGSLKLYGDRGQPVRTLELPALAAGASTTVTVNEAGVNLLELIVPVAFALDDVAFAVGGNSNICTSAVGTFC